MDDTRANSSGLTEPLTEREEEILACLAEGLSNQEIANRLHLAGNTVRWYNSQIYSKLGVDNREAALVAAEAFNLVETVSDETTAPLANHNLPAQTTAFVGRQSELADIAHLMSQPDTRLVTILAPGGMGKTRLGLAVAEQQLRHFHDGVFFVSLAPINSTDNIVTTIAEVVGLSSSAKDPPMQQLLDYLHSRHMLLVLDNFEHLLEGASLVTEIMQVATKVKVLATSRERLNLSGETVYTLSGLRFPGWETLEDALEYDAVRLFMQSAQRVRPDFTLRTEDLDYLAHICRLTEGMPLGLILAAGWVDVLTLSQIVAEIQQGIDILETEMRDVPRRQRSVRASFNYTWSRLTESEREAFMKLSVFRDGFTAEAALAIAGASTRHLRKMVDKALIQAFPSGRYDIHELLRQYAAIHLEDTGEAKAIQSAHSRFFLDVMQMHEADLKGSKQLDTLKSIDADRENIYAAWCWAVAHDDAEAISRSVETLSIYVHIRSSLQVEAEPLLRQAQEHFTIDQYPQTWARVALRYTLLLKRGTFDSRQDFHDLTAGCLAIAEAHGDLREIALCKKLLATHSYNYDRAADTQANELIHEVLAIYETLGDPFGIANTLKWIGMLAPDMDTALAYYEQSAAVARNAGNPAQVADALVFVAINYLRQGRYTDSETAGREVLPLLVTLGNHHLQVVAQGHMSLVKFFTGRFSEARELCEEAVRIGDRFGLPYPRGMHLAMSALLDTLAPEQEALALQEERLATVRQIQIVPRAVLLNAKMIATYTAGDHQAAWAEAVQRLQSPTIAGFLPFKFAALAVMAMLLADEGETVRAVEVLGLALTHSASPVGWLEDWPLLSRKHEALQTTLSPDDYAAAWERGAGLDLETVVVALVKGFAGSV